MVATTADGILSDVAAAAAQASTKHVPAVARRGTATGSARRSPGRGTGRSVRAGVARLRYGGCGASCSKGRQQVGDGWEQQVMLAVAAAQQVQAAGQQRGDGCQLQVMVLTSGAQHTAGCRCRGNYRVASR